jgi:hypothetical protein
MEAQRRCVPAPFRVSFPIHATYLVLAGAALGWLRSRV